MMQIYPTKSTNTAHNKILFPISKMKLGLGMTAGVLTSVIAFQLFQLRIKSDLESATKSIQKINSLHSTQIINKRFKKYKNISVFDNIFNDWNRALIYITKQTL